MAQRHDDDDTVRVTVRLPRAVATALEHLPNRSEFVREAVESRMATLCPMCGGTGRVIARATNTR